MSMGEILQALMERGGKSKRQQLIDYVHKKQPYTKRQSISDACVGDIARLYKHGLVKTYKDTEQKKGRIYEITDMKKAEQFLQNRNIIK